MFSASHAHAWTKRINKWIYNHENVSVVEGNKQPDNAPAGDGAIWSA